MFQNNFVYFPVYLATQLKVIRSTVWNWNTLNKELNILNSCWVGAIWKWHENLRKKGSTATLVDAKEAGEKPSRTSGVPGGVQTPPPKFRRPSKIVPNSTRLWKLLKIAEFRTPTHPDIQKKGSKIRKLPPVRNCFTLAMTNKLVVIIIVLKYQKLRKFYYMKWNFLYQITAAFRTPE